MNWLAVYLVNFRWFRAHLGGHWERWRVVGEDFITEWNASTTETYEWRRVDRCSRPAEGLCKCENHGGLT